MDDERETEESELKHPAQRGERHRIVFYASDEEASHDERGGQGEGPPEDA